MTFFHVGNLDSSNPLVYRFHISDRAQLAHPRTNARISVHLSRYRRETGNAASTTPSTVTSGAEQSHIHTLRTTTSTAGTNLGNPAIYADWSSLADMFVQGRFRFTSSVEIPTNVSKSAHSHSVPGSSHSHSIIDGITESSVNPAGVAVQVNGHNIVTGLSGNGTTANNLSFTNRLQTGWNTISISASSVARVSISGFIELVLNT